MFKIPGMDALIPPAGDGVSTGTASTCRQVVGRDAKAPAPDDHCTTLRAVRIGGIVARAISYINEADAAVCGYFFCLFKGAYRCRGKLA